MHMLDGLIFPDRGSTKTFGTELKEDSFNDREFGRLFRSMVGLVFQNPDVHLFCPTVREDILFAPLHLGFEKERIKNSFEEVVKTMHLEKLLDRSPHQLSVGEKRKVSIASILVYSPEVLLLDEPTAGLDPKTTRELMDLLITYHEQGRTIITATHDLHIAEEISDTVYVLNQEKVFVQCGPTAEILGNEEILRQHNLVHIHSHRHKERVHIHLHRHEEHHD